MTKKRLLLHTCCAPCVTYVHQLLLKNYEVTALFYNPNIYPQAEYIKRRDELIHYASNVNLPLTIEEKHFDAWYTAIEGLEAEPEGAKRCWNCYNLRLEITANHARQNNFDVFTTALSISPHKNAQKINELGLELQNKYSIEFLEADFKKNNGFKKSAEISREYNLYRQTYCGCQYSIRK